MSDYLVDGALPAAGASCPAPPSPFAPPPPFDAATQQAGSQWRGAVLPDMVREAFSAVEPSS